MTAGDFIDRLFENLAEVEDFESRPFGYLDRTTWPEALAAFGREAVSALMRQARKGKCFRLDAMRALGHLKGEAVEAGELLVGVLREMDKSGVGRGNIPIDSPSLEASVAEDALCMIKPIDALPKLIRILTHGPEHARSGAARVCAAMGAAARPALPALRRRMAVGGKLEATFREAIADIEAEDLAPDK